jgi:hypothetical protein
VRALPLLLLAFLLVGCGFGGAASTPEPSVGDGLTRYEISSGRFSIGVPETWHATTSTQMRKASFKRFANQNPTFAAFADAVGKKNSPFKFFAYDPVVRKRFATNLNVVVKPVRESVTPEKYERSALAEAKQIAISKVNSSEVGLPAGKALRVEYRARFVIDGRKKAISTTQYAFLLDKTSYVLTYTTLPALRDDFADLFKLSAESFQLLSR